MHSERWWRAHTAAARGMSPTAQPRARRRALRTRSAARLNCVTLWYGALTMPDDAVRSLQPHAGMCAAASRGESEQDGIASQQGLSAAAAGIEFPLQWWPADVAAVWCNSATASGAIRSRRQWGWPHVKLRRETQRSSLESSAAVSPLSSASLRLDEAVATRNFLLSPSARSDGLSTAMPPGMLVHRSTCSPPLRSVYYSNLCPIVQLMTSAA